MSHKNFQHVDTWVFDLDHTLYPPEYRLFDQIEARMTRYVMDALKVDRDRADMLRKTYWKQHGTTLAGLMQEHDLDPEPYLADVHDIDLSEIPACGDLRAALLRLPGRRIIHTNGSREHAHRVSAARGLNGVFDAVYGIEDTGYVPKPAAGAFSAIRDHSSLNARSSAMFEDDPRNLEIPYLMGMRTVLVGPPQHREYIDHQTPNLVSFLSSLV